MKKDSNLILRLSKDKKSKLMEICKTQNIDLSTKLNQYIDNEFVRIKWERVGLLDGINDHKRSKLANLFEKTLNKILIENLTLKVKLDVNNEVDVLQTTILPLIRRLYVKFEIDNNEIDEIVESYIIYWNANFHYFFRYIKSVYSHLNSSIEHIDIEGEMLQFYELVIFECSYKLKNV